MGAGGLGPARSAKLSAAPAAAWAFAALLVLSLVLGLVAGRRPASAPLATELAYLAQATSLWQDRDLAISEAESESWGVTGEELRVRVLFPYALLLAPAVALAPASGPLLVNTVLLALAATLGALGLRRRTGGDGWPLVTLCVFGSVTFAYSHLAQPQVFLLAAVVAAFALAYGGTRDEGDVLPEVYEGGASGGALARRWLAVGGLLALPVLEHPIYLFLYGAAFAAASLDRAAISR